MNIKRNKKNIIIRLDYNKKNYKKIISAFLNINLKFIIKQYSIKALELFTLVIIDVNLKLTIKQQFIII